MHQSQKSAGSSAALQLSPDLSLQLIGQMPVDLALVATKKRSSGFLERAFRRKANEVSRVVITAGLSEMFGVRVMAKCCILIITCHLRPFLSVLRALCN